MNYVSMGPIDELSVILRCSSIIGTKEIVSFIKAEFGRLVSLGPSVWCL